MDLVLVNAGVDHELNVHDLAEKYRLGLADEMKLYVSAAYAAFRGYVTFFRGGWFAITEIGLARAAQITPTQRHLLTRKVADPHTGWTKYHRVLD